MDITIKLNDDAAKKILEDGLISLSHEEITNIIKDALAKFFETNQIGKGLIYEDSYLGHRIGPILEKALDKIDFTDFMQKYKDKICEDLVQNYSQIIERTVLSMMINGLTSDWQFQNQLRDSIERIMTREANK